MPTVAPEPFTAPQGRMREPVDVRPSGARS
jgi:hypothetical protein